MSSKPFTHETHVHQPVQVPGPDVPTPCMKKYIYNLIFLNIFTQKIH